MSSQSYQAHSEHAARHARTQTASSVSRHLHQRAGDSRSYTFTHAGHQVRIGPVAFWIVVGTLVVMGTWTIATGTYFAFRDDVLTRLIARQANMQFAYEDRIAELRAQVDRVTSNQLLDQEQFERKLQALLHRQTTLEQRTSTLTGEIAPGAGTSRSGRERPSASSHAQPRPSPISDTVIFVAPPDREARLQSRGLPDTTTQLAAKAGSGGLDGMLAKVALSLDRVEKKQTGALAAAEEELDTKARRIHSVLADLGINLGGGGGKSRGDVTGAVGGPFVPLRAGMTFERQLSRISRARSELARYQRALVTVPIRKPIVGDVDMSSPFGARMDPFLRGPAIHTGIDLRGQKGDPVRVTAAGKVVTASWQGGYGNMIEVDHGHGLSTRYGHLSAIEVKVGQHVTPGQTIGRIGSTGRSTGPHLHYETRVDDVAVNPQKFLRAGVRLGNS
ncbi:MAG: peptidoglycan DD-metalloendopeptidase family protein [Xanthobacteraceae bacterium]|uniref:peptidoglycan DD-metalloendopeptidase family protein n=1 Tax=Pseudolabrys sp. TaxID=1960880 RepID=UPI003D1165CC